MEVFEVHITGDERIHEVAAKYGHKTIAIDLLRRNRSTIRTEHMTSLVMKFPCYDDCKREVDSIVATYASQGVQIIRVKIESPFYKHYIHQSLYMESHFETDYVTLPISRNQKKTTYLATDREWDRKKFFDFADLNAGRELELCLWDSFPEEDADWFEEYKDAA